MAHDPKNLMVQPTSATWGDGADKVLHHAKFITDDAAAAVEAADYFLGSYRRLPKGTILDGVVAASSTPVRKSYVVLTSAVGGITIG